jgi:hypothetical protein
MTDDPTSAAWYWIYHSTNATGLDLPIYPMFLNVDFNTFKATLKLSGQMQIGTLAVSGLHSDNKLSVDGKIVAKNIVVTLTNWSDFVFEENYHRMSVLDKETFYKKEKHLPNINSAKEIEADGLQVVTTMNGMMQNIEENTLDIADLYKKILLLEKENSELKESIKQLQK